MPAITAPGIPHLLRYGRSMFGSFFRSRTNEVICMMYEITAANTAMFSSAATICAPSSFCCSTYTSTATA